MKLFFQVINRVGKIADLVRILSVIFSMTYQSSAKEIIIKNRPLRRVFKVLRKDRHDILLTKNKPCTVVMLFVKLLDIFEKLVLLVLCFLEQPVPDCSQRTSQKLFSWSPVVRGGFASKCHFERIADIMQWWISYQFCHCLVKKLVSVNKYFNGFSFTGPVFVFNI